MSNGRSARERCLVTLFILFIFCLMYGVSAAILPLATEQSGTVSGGLYGGAFQPVPFGSQPASGVTVRDFDQKFEIPAYANIQWARLYVNVYSGSGSGNWPLRTTTTLDTNGDGTYETTLGVEDMNIPGSPDGEVYWLNGHCNRVYSDYEVWYDVTEQITSTTPAVHVKTEDIDVVAGDSFDGRLKAVTLIVAYNDGDTDQVRYWVNHGHLWIDSGTSSTAFTTSSIPSGFTAATLSNLALSSKDGTFTFNGGSLSSANPVSPINFFENHTWDVTGSVTAGLDSTFVYGLGTGASFKTTLATLAVRNPQATPPPVAGFSGSPQTGDAPLTVTFTDQSKGVVTVWDMDFGDGSTHGSGPGPWVHEYSAPGTYSVNLTVTGPGGTNTKTETDYITVTSPPLPTIEITLNPSSVTLSGMISGQEATGQSTVTATASNGNSWSVAASDGKATNRGFMVSGMTPLGSALQLGKSGTAYQPLTSDYTSFMRGSSMGSFSEAASLKQPILAADPLGTYEITVTFTGAIS
jgi:PKD repeat protein